MKTVRFALFAAGFLVLANSAFAQRGPDAARHGWLSDYRQARDQARQTGKPIMLVFRCIP
jgi:hypothetical protein